MKLSAAKPQPTIAELKRQLASALDLAARTSAEYADETSGHSTAANLLIIRIAISQARRIAKRLEGKR